MFCQKTVYEMMVTEYIYIIYHVLKWGKHKNWKEYENIWRTKNGYIFVAAKPAWAG